MAKKVILGSDIARDAFKVKVNENFTELYDKDVALGESINSFAPHLTDLVMDADGAHGLKMESGTWTPTVLGDTNPNVTYVIRTAQYVRVGKILKCNFFIRCTLTGGGGALYIGGFPINIKNVDDYGTLGKNSLDGIALDFRALYTANGNSNKVRIYKNDMTSVAVSNVNTGKTFDISGSMVYEIV